MKSLDSDALLLSILLHCSLIACTTSISLDFQVKEHSELGLVVGDLWESYKYKNAFLSNVHNIHFQMMKENKFISLVSGKLIVKGNIDREKICVKINHCCCLNLLVLISRLKTQLDYFEIRIDIEDINDNAPSWTESQISLNIPEHTKIGSKYHLPLAKDPDLSPKNSISKYTLKYMNKSHLKLFSLDYNSISQKFPWNQLLLKVDSDIDHEKLDKIELLLTAEDSGTPPLSGSTSLIISITDINDNPPYFDKPQLEVYIKENNQIDQFLYQTIAKDHDVSDNDKLLYSFGYSMSNEEKSKFFIDPKDGKIFVKQVMDYDSDQNIFNLPIQVTDGSNVAEITLIVKIQNENDNPPSITILPLVNNSNNVLFVEENILEEKIIATLTTEDIDNHSTIISCSCNMYGFKLLKVQPESASITKYTVLLTKPLDREMNEFVQAVITCQDDGYPQQMSRKLLNIRVLDKNDCTPHFSNPGGSIVYIDEGLAIETFIAKLNATDCDSGINAQLVYKIDHVYFTIDEFSGILKTNAVFDRETTDEYKLEVRVYDRRNIVDSDSSEKVLSSVTTFKIIIKDINDCAPVFKKLVYEFGIPEGSAFNSYIGSVVAEDADVEKINRQISYAMVIKPYEKKSHIAKIYFTVTSDGRIFTTRDSLDREIYDLHSFSIEAWDSGPVNHRVFVDVIIKVEDVNDNYPQWIPYSENGLTLNITRHETFGKLITVFKATDADLGLNSTLNYEIIQGNELEIFRLTQKTGSLHLVKQPIISTPDTIRLVIKVSDCGKLPLFNTTIVRINFLTEASKPFTEYRFLEKDLVVMICMITVTMLISAILSVAIVLLKCKHCFRVPMLKKEPQEYRQGHPDGQSSPTASDMFNSTIKLSPDTPLYHNQLYHPNKFIYETPIGLTNFQHYRKPDTLPLYYTFTPKISSPDESTDVTSSYVKSPFSNIYEFQHRFTLGQEAIPISTISSDSIEMCCNSKSSITSNVTSPMLNTLSTIHTNPYFDFPTTIANDTKINTSIKWSETLDLRKASDHMSSSVKQDNKDIQFNNGLITKDQVSSFV